MVQRIQIYESLSTDPYYNLAVEKHLLESVAADSCILYLWQNQNTVVIGRNQNPWVECRLSLLEAEGGKLARRLSGGGAVFHDLGNLNFTFLVPQDAYDLDRQLSVIREACASLGIQAERSGRNDILVDGRKFSGNAFYHSQGKAYHHGTLLVDADTEKLSRYLSPSKAKLEAKGVTSVRSRVVNLRQFVPDLTCGTLREGMKAAFSDVYKQTPETITLSEEAASAIAQDRAHNASWQWLYGAPLPFSFSCDARFGWGGIQLQLEVASGVIKQVQIYTDALDWTIPQTVEQVLTGCCFSRDSLLHALACSCLDPQICDDLQSLIAQQDI